RVAGKARYLLDDDPPLELVPALAADLGREREAEQADAPRLRDQRPRQRLAGAVALVGARIDALVDEPSETGFDLGGEGRNPICSGRCHGSPSSDAARPVMVSRPVRSLRNTLTPRRSSISTASWAAVSESMPSSSIDWSGSTSAGCMPRKPANASLSWEIRSGRVQV